MYKSSLFIIFIIFFSGCSIVSDFATPVNEYKQNANMGYISIHSKKNSRYSVNIDSKTIEITSSSYDNDKVIISVNSGKKSIKIYDSTKSLVYLSSRYVGSDSSIEIRLP
jgi:hypothetical protein